MTIYSYIRGIPAQIDLAVTLIICEASKKNTVHEVLDFLTNFLVSMSPKMTQRTENDTVGRYLIACNFDSKFYVKKQIF